MDRVIIVDDEIWVCRLIKKLIPWDEFGLELIAEAYDGIKAYEIISSQRPDIAIVDIRMPGIDGISLIKKVKEAGMNIDFVIISGHQDFSYAQSAIRYGVENYILKPIEENELFETLKKLRKRHLDRRKNDEDKHIIKKQLDDNVKKLQENILSGMMANKEWTERYTIETLNSEYRFGFKTGQYRVMILKIDLNEKNTEAGLLQQIEERSQEALTNDIAEYCYEFFSFVKRSRVIFILNYSKNKEGAIKANTEEAFKALADWKENITSARLTLSIGSIKDDIHGLKESYAWAERVMKSRILFNEERIIESSGAHYNDSKKMIDIKEEGRFVQAVMDSKVQSAREMDTRAAGKGDGRS